MKIIASLGCIGSGKDYHQGELVVQGYKAMNIADVIRQGLFTILGYWPKTGKEYEDFKIASVAIVLEGRWIKSSFGRQLLQNFGSWLCKDDPEFLVKKWAMPIIKDQAEDLISVNDVRKIEEVLYINKVAEENDIELEYVYNRYPSPRLNITNTHYTEKLAQFLYHLGVEHRQKFTAGELITLLKENNYPYTFE
jgi:hypothetical protein